MIQPIIVGLVMMSSAAAAFAQGASDRNEKPTPGYNHNIPEKIMTPDSVETSLGTLRFFDGMPDEATTDLLYDNLLRLRGVEAFLNGIPATSIEACAWATSSWGLMSQATSSSPTSSATPARSS